MGVDDGGSDCAHGVDYRYGAPGGTLVSVAVDAPAKAAKTGCLRGRGAGADCATYCAVLAMGAEPGDLGAVGSGDQRGAGGDGGVRAGLVDEAAGAGRRTEGAGGAWANGASWRRAWKSGVVRGG